MFVICVTSQICVMCYVLDIEWGGGAALDGQEEIGSEMTLGDPTGE